MLDTLDRRETSKEIGDSFIIGGLRLGIDIFVDVVLLITDGYRLKSIGRDPVLDGGFDDHDGEGVGRKLLCKESS